MKKIILILVLCIFLLSCKPQTPSSTTPRYTEYKTGTQGLEINFIKGQPPEEIWEDSEIIVGLEIQNKGAYPIEEGRLNLQYNNEYYAMIDFPSTIRPLEGKSQFYPEGEFYIDSYAGKNSKKLPLGKEEYETIFTIRACYPYKTEASLDICLNPSEFDYININKQVCRANKVFTLSSQGAPLVITKIEESIIPIDEIEYKVQFIIDIVNRDEGKVRSPEAYYKDCTGTEYLEDSENNAFEIKEVSFSDFSTLASGPQNINCGPYRTIKLKGNRAQIACSAKVKKSRGAFQTPLKVDLEYGYTIEKQTKTKIKKVNLLQ